jgi:acetyltransferase-like isoleucine patch superfamily enzyme
MTEKEKMLAGMIYDANNDAELERERTRAKALCHEFNSVSPTEPDRQREILKKLLGKTHGDSFTIQPSFWCDYGYNIEIGANFFANHNTVILDGAKVKFGDNVWIGGNVTVCPGVTIGSNSVIGAGAVVTHDIPDNSLAFGVPAKVARKIENAPVER